MSETSKPVVKKEIVDIETKFNDKQGWENLDFDNIELVRGKAPDDIEEKCLKLCKDYLAGNWCEQTVGTVEVRRITGGLMNQIYYCGIRQPNSENGVPQEVAIKFYGENNPFSEGDKGKIKDLVVSLIFSEQNIGPKLYGIFDGGVIQKFYKQRKFGGENEKDPEVVQKVFRTLARIHSLEFPIKKNGSQWIEMTKKAYEAALEKIPLKKLIDESESETLKKCDLKTEIDWIKGVVEGLNSPVVFNHSDYRSSNLMIAEPNNQLVVCDYDISSYNYRGNDFVFMMREWGKKHFIHNMKSIEGFPLKDEMRPFIEIYVDECQRIHGKSFAENENNSVEHVLKEAKIMSLFSLLFFTVLQIGRRMKGGEPDKKEFEPEELKMIMENLETNLKNYNTVKGILKDQNLLD